MSSVFDVAGLSPSQSGSERVDADHERAERRSGAVCACVRAVPQEWYTEHSVRRLGFHGTSHRVVSERAAALLGRPVSELRLVTAHLGNGCSATAVRDGVSVDTTMGLTPLDGLVMGTRSGEVDPGVLAYVARRTGQDLDELTRVLNTESGLLGLSGVSNDMRAAT